jgi:hypothetical protein
MVLPIWKFLKSHFLTIFRLWFSQSSRRLRLTSLICWKLLALSLCTCSETKFQTSTCKVTWRNSPNFCRVCPLWTKVMQRPASKNCWSKNPKMANLALQPRRWTQKLSLDFWHTFVVFWMNRKISMLWEHYLGWCNCLVLRSYNFPKLLVGLSTNSSQTWPQTKMTRVQIMPTFCLRPRHLPLSFWEQVQSKWAKYRVFWHHLWMSFSKKIDWSSWDMLSRSMPSLWPVASKKAQISSTRPWPPQPWTPEIGARTWSI